MTTQSVLIVNNGSPGLSQDHPIFSENSTFTVQNVATRQALAKTLAEQGCAIILATYPFDQPTLTEILELATPSNPPIPIIMVYDLATDALDPTYFAMGVRDVVSINEPRRLLMAIEREIRWAQEQQDIAHWRAMLLRKSQLDTIVQAIAIKSNQTNNITTLLDFVATKMGEFLDCQQIGLYTKISAGQARPIFEARSVNNGKQDLPRALDPYFAQKLVDQPFPLWIKPNQATPLDTSTYFVPIETEGTLYAIIAFYDIAPSHFSDPILIIDTLQIMRLVGTAIERQKNHEDNLRFKQLFLNFPIPLYITRREDGLIYDCNQAFVEFSGVESVNDLIGTSIIPYYTDLQERASLLAYLDKSSKVVNHVINMTLPSSEIRWILISMENTVYKGQPALISGLQDITQTIILQEYAIDQQRLAEALRDIATALLSSTLDLSSVLEEILIQVATVVPYVAASIFMVDSAHKASLAYARSNGQVELSPQLFKLIFDVDNTPNLRYMMLSQKPVLIEDTRTYAGWVAHPSTDWIVSMVGVPLIVDKQVIGFLNLDSNRPKGFTEEDVVSLLAFADLAATALQNAKLYSKLNKYTDILEQSVSKRTTELADEKERAEAILNSASDAILLADAQGKILQANLAFYELFKYQLADLPNLSVKDLVTPDQVVLIQDIFEDVMIERWSQRFETLVVRKNGDLFSADVAMSPIVRPIGDVQQLVISFRDITTYVATQKQLESALNKERELVELKSRFVSMASHEFRTPLAVILSASELVRNYGEKLGPAKVELKLKNIHDQVLYMTSILEDVLIIGRMEAGHLSLVLVDINIVTFVQELIEEIRHQTNTQHQIIFNAEAPITDALVDKSIVRRIVNNLLSNAIKYSPTTSPIDVLLQVTDETIMIHIKDYGIGISEDDQHHVFDPFYRGTNVEDIAGTGLGLAIVKYEIDYYGGSISFTSKPNSGTEFHIQLPRIYATPPTNATDKANKALS